MRREFPYWSYVDCIGPYICILDFVNHRTDLCVLYERPTRGVCVGLFHKLLRTSFRRGGGMPRRVYVGESLSRLIPLTLPRLLGDVRRHPIPPHRRSTFLLDAFFYPPPRILRRVVRSLRDMILAFTLRSSRIEASFFVRNRHTPPLLMHALTTHQRLWPLWPRSPRP